MASAARRSAPPFTLAAVLAVGTACALWVDYPIAHWVRDHAVPAELWRFIQFSEIFGHALSLFIAVILIWRLDPHWRRKVPVVLAATMAAGLAANVGKLFIERVRPNASMDIETVWGTWQALMLWDWHRSTMESFPSGHVAFAAGLATSLARFYPRATWLFATLTALVALQRIGVDAHYLSDVLAGASLGIIVAELVARRMEKAEPVHLETVRGNPIRTNSDNAQQANH